MTGRDLKYNQKYLPFPLLYLMLILFTTIGPFSTDMYLSSLPEMLENFNTTEIILNMSLYGFFAVLAVSILILGPLCDRFGRKPVVLASLIIYASMSTLCVYVDDVWIFIAARLLQAVGAGGALVASTAIIKDCFKGSELRNILALTAIISIIGPLGAPVIGTIISGASGWHAIFWFTTCTGTLGFLLALFYTDTLSDDQKNRGSIAESFKRLAVVAQNRPFMKFLSIMTIFLFPYMAFLSVSSYIYQNIFGLTPEQYTVILTCTVLTALLSIIVFESVSWWIGYRRSVTILMIFGAVGAAAITCFGHTGPIVCFLCYLPCVCVNMALKPIGQTVLLSQKKGDAGAESSFINSSVFIIGTAGMITASLPWSDFIYALSFCSVFASIVYIIIWTHMLRHGTGLKGLEPGDRPESKSRSRS